MIQKQNKIKTALCKNVLAFTIFLFAGTTVVNAQLSPVLIQREALLRPVLKQELLSLRSELAARNVKFQVGATEVADRPLLAITGARRGMQGKNPMTSRNQFLPQKIIYHNRLDTK